MYSIYSTMAFIYCSIYSLFVWLSVSQPHSKQPWGTERRRNPNCGRHLPATQPPRGNQHRNYIQTCTQGLQKNTVTCYQLPSDVFTLCEVVHETQQVLPHVGFLLCNTPTINSKETPKHTSPSPISTRGIERDNTDYQERSLPPWGLFKLQ